MVAKQQVLQNMHGAPIQCLSNWAVHVDVESVLEIPNVQLIIGEIMSRLGEKSAGNVTVESTFDLIHPRTSSTTIEVMLHPWQHTGDVRGALEAILIDKE